MLHSGNFYKIWLQHLESVEEKHSSLILELHFGRLATFPVKNAPHM